MLKAYESQQKEIKILKMCEKCLAKAFRGYCIKRLINGSDDAREHKKLQDFLLAVIDWMTSTYPSTLVPLSAIIDGDTGSFFCGENGAPAPLSVKIMRFYHSLRGGSRATPIVID